MTYIIRLSEKKGMKMSILQAALAGGVLLVSSWYAVAGDDEMIRDMVKEEYNRKLVVEFYNGVFNDHNVEEASEVIADDYIQHNPWLPDGKAPFVSFFNDRFESNPEARAEIVRSGTFGDIVYLHVHTTNGEEDRGRAVVDMFRVEDGKIVEHWDVIQDVPVESANQNTMF